MFSHELHAIREREEIRKQRQEQRQEEKEERKKQRKKWTYDDGSTHDDVNTDSYYGAEGGGDRQDREIAYLERQEEGRRQSEKDYYESMMDDDD